MTFTFQGHKITLKPLPPKEVHEDQLKMKTKRENKKEKERNVKPSCSRRLTRSPLTRTTVSIPPVSA